MSSPHPSSPLPGTPRPERDAGKTPPHSLHTLFITAHQIYCDYITIIIHTTRHLIPCSKKFPHISPCHTRHHTTQQSGEREIGQRGRDDNQITHHHSHHTTHTQLYHHSHHTTHTQSYHHSHHTTRQAEGGGVLCRVSENAVIS